MRSTSFGCSGMPDFVEKNSFTFGAVSFFGFCSTTTPSFPEAMRTSEPVG